MTNSSTFSHRPDSGVPTQGLAGINLDRRTFIRFLSSVVCSPQPDFAEVKVAAVVAPEIVRTVVGSLAGYAQLSYSNTGRALPLGIDFLSRAAAHINSSHNLAELEFSFLFNLPRNPIDFPPNWKELYSNLRDKLQVAKDLDQAISNGSHDQLRELSVSNEVRELISLADLFNQQDYTPVFCNESQLRPSTNKLDLTDPAIRTFVLSQVEVARNNITRILGDILRIPQFISNNPESLVAQCLDNPSAELLADVARKASELRDAFGPKSRPPFVPKDWITFKYCEPRAGVNVQTAGEKLQPRAMDLLKHCDGNFLFVAKDGSIKVLATPATADLASMLANIAPIVENMDFQDNELVIFRFSVDTDLSEYKFESLKPQFFDELYNMIAPTLHDGDLRSLALVVREGIGTVVDLDNFEPIDCVRIAPSGSSRGSAPNWNFLAFEEIHRQQAILSNLADGIYTLDYDRSVGYQQILRAK